MNQFELFHDIGHPVKNGDLRPILDGRVNFPLCLAPMVGVTHVALRNVVREYLPANAVTIWPTEMLNSRKLPYESFETTPECLRSEQDSYLIPQILGNEAEPIRKSILKLKEWGAVGIDINMGCPVQKALRHNYGVALMGDAKYAAGVVRMAKDSSDLPVSVKLRASQDGNLDFLVNFVKGLVEGGADWITLHPRTPEQKRRGTADWAQIKYLRDRVDVPVIGNGDIQTEEDVWNMLSMTGADQVMAGRALAARPWLLWQVGETLGFEAPRAFKDSGRKAPRTAEEEALEYGRVVVRVLEECYRYFTPNLALRKFRFYLRMTHVWLDFGHSLHAISTKYDEFELLKFHIEEFFKGPLSMVGRTDLRE